jgi:type II secretory pathway pseudopilin PulG
MRKLSATVAFSLIEVTLALGIAAVCLMSVFALIPIAVQTNRNATSQTAANNIIASAIADIRATPTGTSPSVQFGINIPADATTGANTNCDRCAGCWNVQTQVLYFDSAGQVATATTGLYRLSFTQVRSTTATVNKGGAILADLTVTWPAQADPCAVTPSGSVEMLAAFDRR